MSREYLLAIHPAIEGCGSHDPSAVIFSDGELAFGIEEERLTREKHAPGTFPIRAVRGCLAHCEISLGDVDRVLVPWQPRNRTAIQRIEHRLSELGCVPPIETHNHHRCHAASAFFPSGFDEALVLTVDGRGMGESTVVWHGNGNDLERIRSYETPNSLGYLYAAVTGYLGYRIFDGEGKLMALAAYGTANPAIDSIFEQAIDTGVEYDVRPVVGGGIPGGISRLETLFGRARSNPPDVIGTWEVDLASAVQSLLEGIVVAIVERYCGELGVSAVCLAGGVALNCKLNKRIFDSPTVDRLFVQPVAHDAGSPIGAGLLATAAPELTETVFLGPSCSSREVETLLAAREIAYDRPTDLVETVAKRLADGDLVGWFHGRTEMGPRALGNRSILGDPRGADTRDRINAFVKHREAWRPFSPSILARTASEYLESPRPAPYMVQAFDVGSEKRKRIPAVIHPADGTTRPQIVTRKHRPRYHRLLSAFEERTGVPVLLNTSFNDHGKPIVNTPAEALAAAEGMDLDCLVIEGCLIER